jgi:hypothetical protein
MRGGSSAQNMRVVHAKTTLYDAGNVPHILPPTCSSPTPGTQDVNDPKRPLGRISGPEAGSFTSWVPFLRRSEP